MPTTRPPDVRLRRRCANPPRAERPWHGKIFSTCPPQDPQPRTIGQGHTLLDALCEPLLSSTLLLPGEEEPLTQGWEIKEQLDHQLDAVVDSGDYGPEPTTVVALLQRLCGDRAARRRRPLPGSSNVPGSVFSGPSRAISITD